VDIMSFGETYVTVQGWVGSDLQFKEVGGQTARVSFRVGSTPRHFDRNLGRYVDKTTTWFNVECWRALAQNVFESVRVGQPIVITGRLKTNQWIDEASGEARSRVVLEAFSVGHDLSRGTASFARNAPRSESLAVAGSGDAAPADTTATPYPADEYTATPIPLTPTTPEVEAA
jgi:single-strand DNA-binding protein